MIRSAVAGNIELQEQNVVLRQIIFAVLGFVVILGVAAIDYHLWSSVSRSMYLTTAILLAILYVIGSTLFGSARWFTVGLILIQPSEIAKIVLILVLADYFTRNQEKLGDIRFILRSLALTLGIVIWVLLQPNLSTSIVMMVLWFALLWAAGLPVKYLVLFGVFGITTLAVAFPVLIEVKVIQQYQLDRIFNFLFPNTNASYGDIYNIQQALISIGSGGWFGKGYGHGTQNSAALPQSTPFGLHFRGDGRGVWFYRYGAGNTRAGICDLAHSACSPSFQGYVWRADLLRGRHVNHIPGVRQHRGQPESAAGYRADLPPGKLRRKLAALRFAGHRPGGERHTTPQVSRVLVEV